MTREIPCVSPQTHPGHTRILNHKDTLPRFLQCSFPSLPLSFKLAVDELARDARRLIISHVLLPITGKCCRPTAALTKPWSGGPPADGACPPLPFWPEMLTAAATWSKSASFQWLWHCWFCFTLLVLLCFVLRFNHFKGLNAAGLVTDPHFLLNSSVTLAKKMYWKIGFVRVDRRFFCACALVFPARHRCLLFGGEDEDNDTSQHFEAFREGFASSFISLIFFKKIF